MHKDNLTQGVLAGLMAAGLSVGFMGFASGCKTGECPFAAKKEIKQMNSAEFYTNGKFDGAKAKQAYYDLMRKFHVPVYAALQKDDNFFWAVDFAKGDFASFGMGGVIWVNEKQEGYFGHDIYLLPGQSIAEHRHLPTQDKDGKTVRCKIESWLVRNGWVYGFSEVGTPNLNEFPEAKAMLSKVQIPYLKSVHVEKWVADGQAHKLPGPETWHFMMGGSEGAIVTEFATYHDGAGLRFSVPGVGF
jgi:hypothetical protein